ncbi:MAG: SH3 domain-containing protein [Anaerolineaceae bacterium]|nr:SH3 domain-containing protein [Anaerolineaceae bacterium]
MIHPDQEVHERLANLKADDLWNAGYSDDKGEQQLIIRDRSPQKQTDVSNAQSMITKVMSTVKYKTDSLGGSDLMISPEGLQGKSWALDFTTYRVKARTLYVREGPGITFKALDNYLKWNDVVEVLGYNVAGDWINIRRMSDGLTGWSSSKYLSRIERSRKEEQYRVTAENVNVRKGPGVEFNSLGHLERNEIITAIAVDDKGTWRKIRRSNGQEGWSYARYLSLVQPEPESPPLAFGILDSSSSDLTPTPAFSGLPPSVRFHEISQEEVQALLARAESPDADLAQWWLGDAFKEIARGVKSAVSIVVTTVEKAWAVIIDLGKKVVAWIIDTAEKAVACVEGIIEKIGAVIEEIIKWLRMIFDWRDILHTRDYLRDSINNTLDYMGNRVLKAKKPVSKFFDSQKQIITQGFDQAIEALGGPATNPSTGASSGVSDVFEVVDWILSKVIGNMPVFSTGSIINLQDSDEAKDLMKFWRGTLANGMEVVSALPEALANVINSLLKHPDEPQRIIVALLQMFRQQVNSLLELGEGIVLGLFDLTAYVIEMIKKILKAEVRIPFISDLIEWVGKLLGKNWKIGLGFSLLDASTLILAIPVTLISKIRLGTAPFRNVPTLAASGDAWSITAGVAGYLGGLVDIPLDMVPEAEGGLGPLGSVLETFSLVFAIANTMASWIPDLVSIDDSGRDTSGSEPDFWWDLLLVFETGSLLLDIMAFVISFKKSKTVERLKRFEKGTIILASAMGLIHVTLLIAKDRENFDDIIPDCLMTLPEICSALRLSKNPYVSVAFGIIDGVAAETSLVMGFVG